MNGNITLETINNIFGEVYPSSGFVHNSGNDSIVEKLNALNVTENEIRDYTTTAEFKAHDRGYHALRGLYRAIKTLRKTAAGTKTATAPRKPRAKKTEPAKTEPKKAEPKQTEPTEPTAPVNAMSTAQHKKFLACLDVVTIANRPLLLTGPAGSGKSFLASRIAEACGATKLYTQSKVSFDTDLKGYMDAYGNYVPTALYRAIKRADGGEKTAYFLDEIFAGDTSCLTVINDLLSDGCMTFPNGEELSAENLVIMAADNTNGNGATNQYNTRNKADKSFLNRFGAEHIDYDKEIEKKMARGHKDILDFVRAIRDAADNKEIDIVCSYRTIDAMAKYADAGRDAAQSVRQWVVQDALTTDDLDTLRNDDKIARLIARGNVYAQAL